MGYDEFFAKVLADCYPVIMGVFESRITTASRAGVRGPLVFDP